MTELSEIKPQKLRDPKVGIKSSLPKPKREFALLALLFLANTNSTTINPTEPGPDDKQLRISGEQIDKIFRLFKDKDITDNNRLSKMEESIQESAVVTSQIESLIVAFELFMPLAEVTFSDGRNITSERTGGLRHPKSFRFGAGLLALCGSWQVRDVETIIVFESWIRNQTPPPSALEREKEIKRRVFSLAARTQFKIEPKGASEGTTAYFNILGLYEAVLSKEDGGVSIAAGEKKGALRILNNALESGLLPGLRSEGDTVKLDVHQNTPGAFSKDELVSLVELEKMHQELSNVEDITSNKKTQQLTPSNKDFKGPHNIIVYGVPGSGKSHVIDRDFVQPEDYSARVVFHPDYLYSNFIGQILPSVDGDLVRYDFKPGPFTQVLREAINCPEKRHVLIIEEINRGNAAAIFGDTFQLLDRESDGSSRYCIHNSDIATYVYGSADIAVSLPSNLYLVGTMNTSDQNVFTLDTAFQRRWSMRLVSNDIDRVPFADRKILDTSVTWRRFNNVINSHILSSNDGMTSSEDKRLGAFFVSEDEIKDDPANERAGAFAEKVLKYLWDDALKFNRPAVFRNAGQDTLEDLVGAFKSSQSDARWETVLSDSVVEDLLANRLDSHTAGEPPNLGIGAEIDEEITTNSDSQQI